METAGHRRRWNEKVPVGTTLFVFLFVPTLALLQTSEEHTCPPGDYANDEGICCNKCFPGFKLVEMCQATGQRSNCTPCPAGQFMDQMNFYPNCRLCKRCKGRLKHEYEESACQRDQNTICQCVSGYYKSFIDSVMHECRKCSKCGPDEKEKQHCTQLNNTVCACKENYYKVNNKCEPCKTCSSECKHLCSSSTPMNTKASDPGKEFLINIIAGIATVALVLLVAVVLITHVATKHLTKRELLKLSSQPSDVPPDSSEVLLSYEEHMRNTSVEAILQCPVTEQQLSNLPDCVPLEIKIADLIYTVLDLVPVLQVKQLVRTLGVKDTEIEQAEMDHRSCREARYQMLRVWAERGSCAGGGGRGGLLQQPLWQELLDTLRIMCLGGVVEELETKYGFQ